MYVSKVNSYT